MTNPLKKLGELGQSPWLDTERGRRALRVHLGPDVEGGLRRLEWASRKALS